jgi:tetratricopeptide (TPR) repeat protein
MPRKIKQYTNPFLKAKEPLVAQGPSALSNLQSAIALHQQGNLDQAESIYLQLLEIDPRSADVLHLLGVIAYQTRHYQSAVDLIGQAIEINPNIASYYSNLGVALKELKQFDAAVASYDKAIALKPDYAEAYSNRGNALKELKQFDAAIASYDKAIALKPDYAEAYSNRGVALQDLKQFDAAVASYDKAIVLKPDYAEAYWNKSLLLLLIGEVIKGFNLYEWRWEEKESIKFKRNFSQPLWLGGESLLGKTVLLHAEQGLGDTIQFCRYVRMIADLGATVILEVQKPLVRLLKDLSGVTTLLAQGDPLPDFDFQCPLLSLPLAFKTDLNSIPSSKSYLEAEAERVTYWKDQIKGDGLKIGIAWQGSQGTKIDIGRSFELKLFKNIAALPNVQLISLQKGYGSEQLKNMPSGMQVMDLGEELDADGAFLDSAAVMMNLDLVITSDTALTHLAGALGVKTWVALKYVPDWRWMLDRKDSSWYPSVTLYRQQKIDDWPTVFDQLLVDITLMRKES